MDREQKLAASRWLWLVNCFGCGNNRLWEILSGFDSYEDAYAELSGKTTKSGAILSAHETRNAGRINSEQTASVISYCENKGIGILCFSDEDYPPLLREIYNPPAVLFYKGDLTCLDRELVITVVGTRNPTGNSLNALKGIIGDICKYNTTVISGFAVGIDIAAHLTAIQNGGKTAAVLGCGVDYADYPPDNKKYRNIIEENGVFISEFLPTAKPAPHFFPQRNRILSGLSLGTVVVEAGAKSGALVTAGLALGQGRDIFCFSPPAYNNKEFAGNIGLLRDGAIPVYDSRDILYEYYESHSHKLSNAQGDYLTEKSLDKFVNSLKSKRPETVEAEVPANAGADVASLVFNDDERRIIELLRNSPAPLRSDDICAGCKMSVSDVLTILTDLEMSGAVAQGAGRTYKINE